MTAGLALPRRLDLTEARELARELRRRIGSDLTIDASEVQMLGGLCLQILLAARQDWAQRGLRLTISPRSPAFDEDLAAFGVAGEAMESGGRP